MQTLASNPIVDLVNAHRTYRIEHAGQVHDGVSYAAVPALLAKLTTEHAGVPTVIETTGAAPVAPTARRLVAPPPALPALPPAAVAVVETVARTALQEAYTAPDAQRDRGADDGQVDARGQARSQRDFDAAQASGFAPAQSVYTRGRRVVQVGIDNAREFRAEYEAKPRIEEAMDALIEQVRTERREDLVVPRTALRMDASGRVVVDATTRIDIEQRAFASLTARLGIPHGSQYLAACWPELRARNVNQWQLRAAAAEQLERDVATTAGKVFEADTINLRTRMAPAETRITGGVPVQVPERRVGFAVVSGEGYTEFDVDKLARAVKIAMPSDARAEVHYDGFRAKITALFHSTVNPVDYVAGEFFRAGIVVKTDDTGRGGVRGYAVVEQNLCLNLYILSRKAVPLFSASHIGDPVKLAKKIKEGLKKGEDALAHFLAAWGYARKDDIAAQAAARGELYEGMTMTAIFAALANGAIERELVPVRGKREEAVGELINAWEQDRSVDGPRAGTVTRAGLTNAFTRWAHESPNSNEFFAVEVEQAASDLLWPSDTRVAVPPMIPALPLDL